MGGGSAEDRLDVVAHVGLVQHLVALIEDEVLQAGETKVPVTDEGVDTSRGADDDVRVGILVTEELDVLRNWGSAVEDADLDIGQELGKSVVLVPDLVSQLTGVAHD